jgi:integrase
MGQVFQRSYKAADGTRKTCNVWTIRYYRNGRAFEESTKFTRKGDAKRVLNLREGDIAKGIPVSPAAARLTVDAALGAVVTDYTINRRRSTAHVERRIRKHLLPAFTGQRLAGVTGSAVRAYVQQRQAARASNAEINRELAILKRAFRLAMTDGSIHAAPHIAMLEEHNVRQGFFDRADFEAVRAALPVALQPVVTFAYLTGWRIASEVLPLEWRQVDRAAGVVRLDPGATKNGEGRVLPYAEHEELAALFDAQWREHERLKEADKICPFVFHRYADRIRSFRGAWTAACDTAGCPGRIPHDFRRSAVRNLVRAGIPENTAMQLTGHKTRSIFDRYHIVSEPDLRAAVAKLGTLTVSGQSPRSGVVAPIRKSS